VSEHVEESPLSVRAQLAGAPPVIRVRHLWHRFGPYDVLRDVSFEVGPGEIFGFIGPNGAGKTTTIRIMATLLEPLAGRVEVDGIDVTVDPEAVRRVIGYMPDHAGVYDRVTVREYLEFFADAFRVGSPSVVDAVLELTDLGSLADKIVATMSKGQKQRLQLARILLHDPKVLILDEPASDLDPRARIEMRNLLAELRSLGKTIFLSSHILTELSDVCTSIGIMERGRLVVAGPIAEIGARLEAQRHAASIGHAGSGPQPGAGAPPGPPAAGPPVAGPAGAPGPAQYPAPYPGPYAGAYGPRPPGPYGYGWPPPQQGIAARRKVKLRTLAPPEHVANLVRNGGGVVGVEVVGPSVVVTLDGPESRVADMVGHLVRNNVGVTGVEQERNELERIFLEVTQGDMQ
jgi:ABC-2 type transport system ATP-binding protein